MKLTPEQRAKRVVHEYVMNGRRGFSLTAAIAGAIEDAVKEVQQEKEFRRERSTQIRPGIAVCDNCGKEFPVKRRDGRFCHMDCCTAYHTRQALARYHAAKKEKEGAQEAPRA